MNRGARLELDGLLIAGAVGGGVHAGIAPEHLREWAPLGAAFIAAAALLAAAVAAVALRPDDRRASLALTLLLATIVAAYLSTRLTAVPLLDPEREPFDALGVSTTLIETAGLFLGLRLSPPRRRAPLSLFVGGTR